MRRMRANEKDRIANMNYKKGYDDGFVDGYTTAIDDAGWIRSLINDQQKAFKMIERQNDMSWHWAQKELKRLQKAILFFTKTPN